MNDTAAVVVTVVITGIILVPVLAVVVAQVRHNRRVRASGQDSNRIALELQRKGYARGLVPVVEDLLDRVEALEAEVDRLTASQRDT